MPRLSLTDLIDVVSKVSTQKRTKLRQVKSRGEYEVASDFYKAFRDRLIAHHKAGGEKSGLQVAIGIPSDGKKVAGYARMVGGYAKWWGKKKIQFFAPPSGIHASSGVAVSVNPELGLKIGNSRLVVKLYLRGESELNKSGASLILGLMEKTLRPLVEEDIIMAVIDVGRGKFFEYSGDVNGTIELIDAELAWIASLWDKI